MCSVEELLVLLVVKVQPELGWGPVLALVVRAAALGVGMVAWRVAASARGQAWSPLAASWESQLELHVPWLQHWGQMLGRAQELLGPMWGLEQGQELQEQELQELQGLQGLQVRAESQVAKWRWMLVPGLEVWVEQVQLLWSQVQLLVRRQEVGAPKEVVVD